MSGNAHQRRKKKRQIKQLIIRINKSADSYMSASSSLGYLASISLGYIAHEIEIIKDNLGNPAHHP